MTTISSCIWTKRSFDRNAMRIRTVSAVDVQMMCRPVSDTCRLFEQPALFIY